MILRKKHLDFLKLLNEQPIKLNGSFIFVDVQEKTLVFTDYRILIVTPYVTEENDGLIKSFVFPVDVFRTLMKKNALHGDIHICTATPSIWAGCDMITGKEYIAYYDNHDTHPSTKVICATFDAHPGEFPLYRGVMEKVPEPHKAVSRKLLKSYVKKITTHHSSKFGVYIEFEEADVALPDTTRVTVSDDPDTKMYLVYQYKD